MDTPDTSSAAPADSTAEAGNEAVAVSFQDFRSGLPHGRFRVIVNPEKAKRYIMHRLFVNGFSVPMIGLGIGIVFWGHLWPGLCLGALGIVLRKLVQAQAPRILLHLATSDGKVYWEAIEYEIMEVRYAQG